MSFAEDSFKELNNTGLGDLLLNRPGTNKRGMPSHVILSSQCTIIMKFSSDNIEQQIELAEFDQFNKSKRISEKKNFKPYGFTKNISLINDDGWDLSFSGKKTSRNLSYFIFRQEEMLAGAKYGVDGNKSVANGGKILLEVIEIIKYKPDSKGSELYTETYAYKNCSLVSYSEENPSDNQPLTFNLTLFCQSRDLLEKQEMKEFFSPEESTISNMINEAILKNTKL